MDDAASRLVGARARIRFRGALAGDEAVITTGGYLPYARSVMALMITESVPDRRQACSLTLSSAFGGQAAHSGATSGDITTTTLNRIKAEVRRPPDTGHSLPSIQGRPRSRLTGIETEVSDSLWMGTGGSPDGLDGLEFCRICRAEVIGADPAQVSQHRRHD